MAERTRLDLVALLRVEVIRAVRPDGAEAVEHAVRLMRRFELVRIGRLVLGYAASLEPLHVRTLDAIHLATAEVLTRSRYAVVPYGEHMLHAADQLGLRRLTRLTPVSRVASAWR